MRLFSASLLLAMVLSVQLQAEDGTIEWHDNLQEAHQIAKAQDKPMMIVFGASWCRYCKKLDRETINHPSIAPLVQQQFVPVHLDLDKEKRIAKILEVKSLPCTVMLSPNADLLGRVVGFRDTKEFRQDMNQALKTQLVLRQAAAKQNSMK